jgi:hypothetical protein
MFYSADWVKESDGIMYNQIQQSQDYLALMNQNGVPPHELQLKEGCICSLMRNMSIRKHLVKNARMVVERIHRRFVQVCVINNRTGVLSESHCIPRIRFEFHPYHASWTICRLQYPLCLAYATTFNRCVGLTLDQTVLDLRHDVFAHGQLYTALSQVRKREDSHVLFDGENKEGITTNVVYRELLL